MYIVYGCLKFYQIYRFSKFVDERIDSYFSSDEWKTKDIDFNATYSLLSRTAAWNFNFESMIVVSDRSKKLKK